MSTVIKDLGAVSAYAYAVEKGYAGTEAEFAELMADYAEVGQRAEDAAESALNSKTAAQSAATTATDKASEATTAAQTATTKAGEAQTSAQTASSKASEASQSASTASQKATEASQSATNAGQSAQTAEQAKTASQTAQGLAESARDTAVQAKNDAESARDEAQTIVDGISAKASQIDQNTAEIAELKNDGVAPSAEQLLSKNTAADAVPYLFRRTGGDGADREYVDAIVGGTVVWNQLVQDGNFPSDTNWTTLNGSISVSENVCAFLASAHGGYVKGKNVKMVNGHKYFRTATLNANNATSITFNVSGVLPISVASSASYQTLTDVINWSYSTGNQAVRITDNRSSGWTNALIKDVMLIDITAMFGTTIADYIYSLERATAGAGVAFFKSLFPNDYYEYNVGELKSVEGVSAHETVGFNRFDASKVEWTDGLRNDSGEIITSESHFTNAFRVFPNTTYCINGTLVSTGSYRLYYLTKSEEWISRTEALITVPYVFTTPSNCEKMQIQVLKKITSLEDVCINLSDPAKNGTYEPYEAHNYPLDSSLTLRGIPKLSDGKMYYDGDRYLPNGKVERRYGIVDLGRLNWSYSATNTIFMANLATSSASTTKLGVCQKYATVTYWVSSADWANNDKIITFVGGDKYVRIKDTSYTDAATFKEAMSGVYLVYELAEPTIEEATPYRQLQICDPNGTEEFVSTGIVPVGHETRYPENLRAKIDGLPWDFSSLIAPTEKTATASRNYTTGSLLIMGNVLYKVTANIANGGTITPNTNVTATTLSEILSALAQ